MKKLTITAAALALLSSSAAFAKTGEEVYNGSCKGCHLVGVLGAPKFGDKAAWADRIGKGVDALLNTVMTGKPPMPPRGGCKPASDPAGCSDDDLRAAVQYMIDAAK